MIDIFEKTTVDKIKKLLISKNISKNKKEEFIKLHDSEIKKYKYYLINKIDNNDSKKIKSLFNSYYQFVKELNEIEKYILTLESCLWIWKKHDSNLVMFYIKHVPKLIFSKLINYENYK